MFQMVATWRSFKEPCGISPRLPAGGLHAQLPQASSARSAGSAASRGSAGGQKSVDPFGTKKPPNENAAFVLKGGGIPRNCPGRIAFEKPSTGFTTSALDAKLTRPKLSQGHLQQEMQPVDEAL